MIEYMPTEQKYHNTKKMYNHNIYYNTNIIQNVSSISSICSIRDSKYKHYSFHTQIHTPDNQANRFCPIERLG